MVIPHGEPPAGAAAVFAEPDVERPGVAALELVLAGVVAVTTAVDDTRIGLGARRGQATSGPAARRKTRQSVRVHTARLPGKRGETYDQGGAVDCGIRGGIGHASI